MKERIDYLVTKHLDGSASKAEKMELSSILDNDTYKDIVQEALYRLMQEEKEEYLPDLEHWKHIPNQIISSEKDRKKSIYRALCIPLVWKYAATMAVISLSAVYFYYTKNTVIMNDRLDIVQHHQEQIVPGKDKAMLIFPDNSHIDLGVDTTQIAQTDHIINHTQEELVYADIPSSDLGKNLANTSHRIIVPKGGQYRIKFSDGTWVWLNADTEIRYDVGFAQGERRVDLRGEAYFEVAEDANRPFNIYIDGQKHIQVLGTKFNIKAYRDENRIKTSLYQGAVEVFGANETKLLKPGQYAMADNTSGSLTAGILKTEDDMAWRNGNFVFDGENIQEIMRKIGRWYDIDIVYEGTPTDELFRGTVSRFENVREVLNIIELTDIVRFKIEGRRIKVMKQ